MIKLEKVGLSFAGPSGERFVLRDIDLRLERGEAVALMGANGSGKSTLCRCLNGLLVPGAGAVTVDGLSTAAAAESTEIRRRVGMVFQDPCHQLVTWSVAEELAFGLENLGASVETVQAAVKSGLRRWGLEGLRESHPHRLSGGQMAALAVASVMAMNPGYLVVDEPTSLLDRRGRRSLRSALEEVRRSGDVGILYVTQFPEEAALFDRLVVLSGGRVAADGDPRGLLARCGDLAGWGLSASPATLLSQRLRDHGVDLSQDHISMSSLLCELGSLGLSHDVMPPAEMGRVRAGLPILKLRDVGFSYDGKTDVLREVSFDLCPGESLGLVGPSGSGKSTLAFVAGGALKPCSGTVTRPGVEEKAKVGLAAQFPEEQFCLSTVDAEVAMGLRGMGLGSARELQRARKCLESVGIEASEMANRSPLSLSEGEKRKVALASALVDEGSLLVLDEPTLGLDGPSAEKVLSAITGHLRRGGAAIIASHSGDFLFRAAAGVLVLDGNQVVGPQAWMDALCRYGGGDELPEGQLLELALRLGRRPPGGTLESLETTMGWYARLLAEAPRKPAAGWKAASDRENTLDADRASC